MNNFKKIFTKSTSVIGMVHLQALPGTPRYNGSVQKIVDKAMKEADIYISNGLDGILVENMNDIPYVHKRYLKSETTAVMARVCAELRAKCTVPCGVQVLAGGNEQAVAIAQACDFNFVRAEGFVFSHVADEGFMDADAGSLLRYRKYIGAENVLVFTDIKKKHSSHAITNDLDVNETAKAAEFFLSDGIILTGTSTGHAADTSELKSVKNNINLPILIGSGVTAKNIQDYLSADALIIGSFFKKDGFWRNEIDVSNVKEFMNQLSSYKI